MKKIYLVLIGIQLLMSSCDTEIKSKNQLVFSCLAENDLYQLLKSGGIQCARYDTPLAAVQEAKEGGGVLLLADEYPKQTQVIEPKVFALAEKKRIRLYVEYPTGIPGLEVGIPVGTKLERGVITSEFFGPTLETNRILTINDCHFVPIQAEKMHMAVAKVAGYDAAVYGLPKQNVWPLLFEQNNGGIMVATTKLSQFITARYAPEDDWKVIWRMILKWVQPNLTVPELTWTPVVRPSYDSEMSMPKDAECQAVRRGIEWLFKAHMLIHPSWRELDLGETIEGRRSPIRSPKRGVTGHYNLPIGDGSMGILEGFRSAIYYDGKQEVQWNLRTDCTGEHIVPFVLGGQLLNEPKWIEIGKNLADFVLFKFDATAPWRDPAHPAFGLIGWACRPAMVEPLDQTNAFYGVINARICMSTLAAAGYLNEGRWDDRVLQVMLANYRTTGPSGLRVSSLNLKKLEEKGWQHYYNSPTQNLAPMPTAQLLAANLAVYKTTGFQPFLERTKKGLRLLMEAYPDKWNWWNGLQQERARLILPLAWLVRLEDTPEHREWLHRITTDLLKHQVPCGAIQEELGQPGQGRFPSPASNEAYGTSETPIIHNNGDPACDLLYTLNSAFIGLHEAAAATGDVELQKAEDLLAKFLCRIQTRSDALPELDGTWFRAFDFDRWEYWGSNADAGWGAWCVETGWVQGWLVTTFALRQLDTTLWDLVIKRPLDVYLKKNVQQLLP